MKFALRLVLVIASALPVSAFSETILVMDTIEFSNIDHEQGKWRYVNQLTDVLKKMRLKAGEFDAMNSDKNEVYELIQRTSRWTEISAAIDKACKKAEQKKNCANLANIRIDIFDYIKDNPEGVVESGSEPAAHR